MDAIRTNGTGFTSVAGEDNFSTVPVSLSAEQIYHAYAPRVYNVARKMVRNDADAEDVTQDVLLKVVRKLPTFRGASALPTWLHRVTVNAVLSHRRKLAVREEGRLHDPFDTIVAETADALGMPTPEVQLVRRESHALIERAIAKLPPLYREVFLLADVDELPNAQIAERLNLSLPAVKSRLHRARQLLRDALAPHFAELSA